MSERFPAIPVPTETLGSQRVTLLALKESVEMLTGQRGVFAANARQEQDRLVADIQARDAAVAAAAAEAAAEAEAEAAAAVALVDALRPKSASGVGQIVLINPGVATNYTLPSGGSWLVFRAQYSTGGAYAFVQSFDILAGGTALGAPGPGFAWIGWAWRIA